MILVEKMVDYLLENELISEADCPWLYYALEKRYLTYVFLLPIAVFGILLTNIYLTVTFLSTYFFVRGIANGFHAKTKTGCFILSALLEFVFLGLIYPSLTLHCAFFMFVSSEVILFLLAPYNHPGMHLSTEDINACRTILRKRLLFLGILFVIAYKIHNNIMFGISIGVAMASFLLCLVYILNWRITWKTH